MVAGGKRKIALAKKETLSKTASSLTDTVNLAAELVRRESIHTKPEAIQACLTLAKKFFADLPVQIQHYEHAGVPSLVVTLGPARSAKHPRVFLAGHVDVVGGRTRDFEPRVEEGRLYGRGAADMKGVVAAMMMVMREAALSGEDFSLGLMLSGDEEQGGFNGTGYLVRQEKYCCDVAFVPDGGQDFHLVDKVKGVLHVKLIARGISGHGSRPWEGENAIDRLLSAYQKVRALFPWDGSKHESITVNLGQIQGGSATNQIPNLAEAHLDIRFPAGVTAAEILRRLQQALPDVEVEEILHTSSYALDQEHPLVQRYRAIAEGCLGKKMELMDSLGDCDARFFVEAGIPAIITLPVIGKIHGDNEWIDIASLGKFQEILRQFVWEVAR